MLRFENFSKTYPSRKRAVDHLNLEVKRGEIMGFIGHNGAGKTTAIRCAVGVLAFEEGDILIDGVSIRKEPVACKQKLAYIPDNPDLYDHLTGLQYVDFIADIFGVSLERRRAQVERYARAFELAEDMGQLISSYSHGMKQKLAIIAALAHDPELLVLDEPFVGLDPKAAHVLKEIMRALCEKGTAIFFSTHVLEVAEKLCDRIAIIKNGKLLICDETEAVRGDSSLEDVFLELIEQ